MWIGVICFNRQDNVSITFLEILYTKYDKHLRDCQCKQKLLNNFTNGKICDYVFINTCDRTLTTTGTKYWIHKRQTKHINATNNVTGDGCFEIWWSYLWPWIMNNLNICDKTTCEAHDFQNYGEIMIMMTDINIQRLNDDALNPSLIIHLTIMNWIICLKIILKRIQFKQILK